MNSMLRPAFVFALALGVTIPAAQAQTMAFDCDSPSGHFTSLTLSSENPLPFLSAFIAPVSTYSTSAQFPARARIELTNAARTVGIAFNLTASKPGKDAPLVATIETIGGQREPAQRVGQLNFGQKTLVQIGFTGDREVTVRVAGKLWKRTIELGPKPVLRVGCSTGEFRFEGLTTVVPVGQ